jgi:hypothetical protein
VGRLRDMLPRYFSSWENPEIKPPRLVTEVRSWAGRSWFHKAVVYLLLIACALLIGSITVLWTLLTIFHFWIGVFSEERPLVEAWYHLLGPLLFIAIIYGKGWLHLRLTEPREWSRLKLAWRAIRFLVQSLVGLHLVFASILLITGSNYWIGLIVLMSAFATLAHRAVYVWSFDDYMVDPEPPLTRNDRLALVAIWSMSLIGIFLFSFYFIAMR